MNRKHYHRKKDLETLTLGQFVLRLLAIFILLTAIGILLVRVKDAADLYHANHPISQQTTK